MKKRYYLILFFCLLIGYIIFSPHQLKKELIFVPSWVSSIETVFSESSGSDPVPFKLGSTLGYFSADGRILYKTGISHDAAVSEDFFANYSSVSENIVLQDSRGGFLGNIETEGMPFFINDRFFAVSPDRMSIQEYDKAGNELLKISPGSVITSFDAGTDIVVAGMLNGNVSVYSDGSEPDYSYFSTDSRYSVTYSCAVSEDGKKFAAITGLYPQQLVCFELKNESWIPVYQQTVTPAYRRNVLLEFSDDGKFLSLESVNGFEMYSTATFIKKEVVVSGKIKDLVMPGEKDMSFIVSGTNTRNIIRVYRPDLGGLAEFLFPAGDIYFSRARSCFYVCIDNKIIRYDIIEG